jgi:cysteinyl-tRNA synthetase
MAGVEHREVSLDAETRRLIKERELARGRREWKKADEIRDLLAARGILLQDGAGGTTVRIAAGKRNEKAVTSDGNSC